MLNSLLSDARTFLTLTIIAIFLIIADNFQVLNFPKALMQNITAPIQYGLYKTSLSFSKQFEFITLSRRAAQENKALNEQMANILSENANLRKRLAEAESFTEQQKSLNTQTFNLTPARPLGISRYLIIDKGTDDGIKFKQPVVYKDNFIGQIIEVSPKKSKILLSQDPDSRVSAFAQSEQGKARGILVGQFGSDMLLDKVLHQEPLNKDDLIYSEGQEVEIPRGLILGQVSEVVDKDNEVFKQAKVKPIFDPASLEVVFVITN